jgi:hypothetical protein
MSSVYFGADIEDERRLSELVTQAMGVDFEAAYVSIIGRRAVLRGMAPSYIAKARATATLRSAGCTDIENCLRVTPGLPAA